MAKRRRSGSRGRDFSTTPNRYPQGAPRDSFDDFMAVDRYRQRYLPPFIPVPYVTPDLDLTEFEDRRTWHPDPVEPAQSAYSRPARLRAAPPPKVQQRPFQAPRQAILANPPARVAFQDPRRVLICVRRNIRRGVLHALGVAGGSTASHKKRSKSAYSAVSCKE